MNVLKKISVPVVLAVAVLWSCGKKGDEQGVRRVTIGTFSRAIDYSPYYVARHFGWFSSPKFGDAKIEFKEFNDRPSISAAFDSGDLDVLFAAEPPAIICRAQGNDIRIAGISCTLQQEIVVRRELPINSVGDLRGRKIAVLQGTSSHYGLLKILRSAGLSSADVDIRFMGPDQAKVAFETGQIDGWAVWPPFIEQQQVNGRGRVLSGGDAVIQSIVAIRKPILDKNSDVASAIIGAVEQSKQWIRENPEEAQSIVAKELGLDVEVVKTAWAKHNWSAQLTPEVISDIQEKARFLATEKTTRLGKVLDVKKNLIDTRFSGKNKGNV